MEAPPSSLKAETQLAKLESAKHAILFNSGVSTVSALLASLPSSSLIAIPEDFYSGTRILMTKNFGHRFNFITLYQDTHLKQLEEVIDQVSLVMVETPTNPLLKVYDIHALSFMIQKHREETGTKYPQLAIDSTFCTPLFQSPLALGSDMVLHSCTKFLSGHSDLQAGVICTNSDDLQQMLLRTREQMGNHLEESPSSLLVQGLKTISLRVKRQMESGIKVATYLQSHPKIEKVIYPLLDDFAGKEVFMKQTKGFTGMLSFYVKSQDFDSICEIAKDCRLFKFGTSLGGTDSLLDHYGGTMRFFYTHDEQVARGYTDNFFRMSVGLEDPEDLIADLAQALEKLK